MYFSFILQLSSALSTNNSFGVKWYHKWGGNDVESGYGLAVDYSDKIYFVGYSYSFGPGSSSITVLKYDNSGTLLWNRTWGGYSIDSGNDILLDSTGNIYVVGGTKSYIIEPDMLLVKYNSSGTQLWNHIWGGDNREICYCGAVDSSDNIYLGGFSDTYATWSDMVLVSFGYKEGPKGGDAFPLELIIITSSVIGGGAVIGLAIFILRRRRPK